MKKTTAAARPQKPAITSSSRPHNDFGESRRKTRCKTSLSRDLPNAKGELPADRGACTRESEVEGEEFTG